MTNKEKYKITGLEIDALQFLTRVLDPYSVITAFKSFRSFCERHKIDDLTGDCACELADAYSCVRAWLNREVEETK